MGKFLTAGTGGATGGAGGTGGATGGVGGAGGITAFSIIGVEGKLHAF